MEVHWWSIWKYIGGVYYLVYQSANIVDIVHFEHSGSVMSYSTSVEYEKYMEITVAKIVFKVVCN